MKEKKEKAKNDQEVLEEQDTQVAEKEQEEKLEKEEKPEPTLEEQLGESKDKYIRLYSEFENFRRRTSKEKLDLISTANRNLMSDLIPVMDDFERAMAASESNDDVTALREGM